MNFKITPSHVAVLVPSVRKAANYLKQFDFQIGKEELWDGEGTKEIYIEREKSNSLLLMEPIKSGAYQRALEKRGPGLHHLAINVQNLESYVESLSGSGWLLQPSSLKTWKLSKTIYLARPGFPGLIEVQESKESSLTKNKLFVTEVQLPFDENLTRLLPFIGLETIVRRSSRTSFTFNDKIILLENLL